MVQPYDKRWDAVTLDGHVVTDVLDAPLHWRKPRAVRLHGDLFHDDVPDDFIAQVFAVMALSPHHTFQVLTKRPERMREFMRHVDLSDIGDHFYPLGDRMRWDMDLYIDEWGPLDRWPLPNVWMGTSAEDQPTFDLRVPFLRETPAAVRFVSLEPMIGAINVRAYVVGKAESRSPWSLDWVIVGGESGPKARPFDIQWARDIVVQCQADGVPVFVKQVGARPYYSDAPALGGPNRVDLPIKHRAGADPSEWPEDLRVQQFPEVK